jgi:hypothetical protein
MLDDDEVDAPEVGDRIVVQGILHFTARVKKRLRHKETGEVILILEWSHGLGDSKVRLQDEGEVWYRYAIAN